MNKCPKDFLSVPERVNNCIEEKTFTIHKFDSVYTGISILSNNTQGILYRFCDADIRGGALLVANSCIGGEGLSNNRVKHKNAPITVAEEALPSCKYRK